MKTITNEEPVARSRFIDCPNCKTHTFKLKKIIHVGRCKNCHESYKIIVLYVKKGEKLKASKKAAETNSSVTLESTLPTWQIPSDSSLFGLVPSDSATMFSDTSSIFGQDEKSDETPSGTGQ